MNKGFIFDWSGTLSDNTQMFLEVCHQMFIELGREPLIDDEIRLNFTSPYMKFWNKYFPELTKAKQDELYKYLISQKAAPVLHAGVKEIFDYLSQRGYKLFILSSDHLATLLPEIKRSGLEGTLSKVVGAIHEKGEELVNLLAEFSLDRKQSFYIGDTSGDIEAGKTAGVRTIGITWGFQSSEIIITAKPDYLINDIVAIKGIV